MLTFTPDCTNDMKKVTILWGANLSSGMLLWVYDEENRRYCNGSIYFLRYFWNTFEVLQRRQNMILIVHSFIDFQFHSNFPHSQLPFWCVCCFPFSVKYSSCWQIVSFRNVKSILRGRPPSHLETTQRGHELRFASTYSTSGKFSGLKTTQQT